ncbi:helix-turn-helix domain-containing protein [Candidatus Synechococcus calcipolaris G9]|uniref:Helix-turn-helix domain-containing protein n=1 Tax=Candidatus Synechococcus calcipolaris G9 TaxID=1497997 RepID=A0ABT6EWJ7_9SYNE|nr:helix-turn-helix transcriptional regulator [Candidatus Synechococcus calcipolaris]MDG2989869.1 helix-turn-helix domain-containing protein [Candidatus Synechococcus calcipolaris G9]
MSIKPGSKYYPLYEHLHYCNQAAVTLTFAEIEVLMGCSLPDSARRKKNWWSNRDSSSPLQAGAWISAGYQVECVDLAQQTVTFKTFRATYHIQRQDGEIIWNADAIKALRIAKGLNQEQFASELGVRRETISEWENSKYEPDRSKCKLLNIVAKQVNFAEPSTDS